MGAGSRGRLAEKKIKMWKCGAILKVSNSIKKKKKMKIKIKIKEEQQK